MSKEGWYAFYSEEAIELQKKLNEDSNSRVLTNFYRLKGSDKLVEVTCVFRVDEYDKPELYPYNFDDKEYLGIVDAWIKVGKVY